MQLPKKKRVKTDAEIARADAKREVSKALSAHADTLESIASRAVVPQPLALDLLAEMAKGGTIVAERSVDGSFSYRRPRTQTSNPTHLRRLDGDGAFCLGGEKLPKSTRDLESVTCKACRARLAKHPQARIAYEQQERAAS